MQVKYTVMDNTLPRWEQNYDEDTAADVIVRVKDAYFQAFVRFYERMNNLSSYNSADLFTQSE